MKKIDVVLTKSVDDFGVAFLDLNHDHLIRNFNNFDKTAAKEICRYINGILEKNFEHENENGCAKIIGVENNLFYVVKEFSIENGDILSFSSHGFLDEEVACRCGAILETALNTEDNADDYND